MDIRNKLLESGIDLLDPKTVVSLRTEMMDHLMMTKKELLSQGETLEAAAHNIWLFSLFAVDEIKLRKLGRKMWGQLERGFKHCTKVQDDVSYVVGRDLCIDGFGAFPIGLTPVPLD